MEKDKNVYEAPWLIPVTTIVTGVSLDDNEWEEDEEGGGSSGAPE